MSLEDSGSYSNREGSKGRLNNLGWSPKWEDQLATLKIDFGIERRKITAVAVQSKEGQFVSAYELVYSEEGLSWRHWVVNAYEKVCNLFYSLKVAEMTFYVKPFYRDETPKFDRELCVAAHLFVEESLTMITKTDRDWLE